MTHQDNGANTLPACVTEYINQVIRRMRYSRGARQEVRQELTDHFTDALADCPDPQQRQKLAERLIGEFGDTKMLAALLRRAKKRNRPAWVKAMIRTAQAFLLLIGLFVLYTAWFMNGRPTISTNYLAVLSERLQPKAPESENAWPFYRQAMLRYVPPGDVTAADTTQPSSSPGKAYASPEMDVDIASMPDSLRKVHDKWMERNEPAWQEFLAASRKPYCWYAYGAWADLQWDLSKVDADRKGYTVHRLPEPTGPDELVWKDSAVRVLLPHLSAVRQLSRIGVWKSRLDSAQGDTRQAVEDVLAVARVARHWQDSSRVLIEQLVGIAVSNYAYDQVRRLAAAGSLTAADLQRVQDQLDALYKAGYPTLGLEFERLSFVDTVQRLFTDGGPGGGHMIPGTSHYWWESIVSGVSADSPKGPGMGVWTAVCLAHAGRDQTLAMGNACYDQMAEWSGLTPYQRKDRHDLDDFLEKLPKWRYTVLRIFLPAISRAADLSYRARGEYEATLTVLALQRYRLDKGRYPPDLATLVRAGYLRKVPADPYSAGLLVYRSAGDAFTLYSVAGDFRDDGGVQDPDDPWNAGQATAVRRSVVPAQGAPATQPKPGDRVFWPVAPLKPYRVEAE
jgi:hypothetical protein